MIQLIRTDSSHPDFIDLVKQLDADLAVRDGEDHDFYHQYNGIADIKYAIVAHENEVPISCGAIKAFDAESVEVKRMYTVENGRGQGIASKVLAELEQWAKELGYQRCILETGARNPEAIGLYQKYGYQQIPNYGQYAGVENSRCFEKRL
ncbi:MAG: GNAT family N-acetyltransferase [Bacteroidota bacterium]